MYSKSTKGNISHFKLCEIEKPNVIFDLVDLIRLDVITYDDLADFSEDMKQAVKMLFDRYR